MKTIVCKNYEELSREGANLVAQVMRARKDAVLGLATGSTPVGMYQCLQKMVEEGEVSFRDVTTVNLDEYYPIDPKNDQSYRYFMDKNLFDHVDVDKERTHVLNGLAQDPEKECEAYEDLIESLGGIDIQVLGIGRNGHIGFNEPGALLYPRTHRTDLTESTIEANSRFFSSKEEVPTASLTMGIGTILKARRIIVLASGKDKKDAVRKMLSDTIDTSCPASLLCLHGDVTVICTEDCLD